MRTIFHVALLLSIATGASAFTEKQIEDARQWSLKTRDAFWACLQNEVRNKITVRMTAADFAIYVHGVCGKEMQSFRVPLVDYLAMRHPEIPDATHLAQADAVIQQWRDAAVKAYLEALYERK